MKSLSSLAPTPSLSKIPFELLAVIQKDLDSPDIAGPRKACKHIALATYDRAICSNVLACVCLMRGISHDFEPLYLPSRICCNSLNQPCASGRSVAVFEAEYIEVHLIPTRFPDACASRNITRFMSQAVYCQYNGDAALAHPAPIRKPRRSPRTKLKDYIHNRIFLSESTGLHRHSMLSCIGSEAALWLFPINFVHLCFLVLRKDVCISEPASINCLSDGNSIMVTRFVFLLSLIVTAVFLRNIPDMFHLASRFTSLLMGSMTATAFVAIMRPTRTLTVGREQSGSPKCV
ncbi:hypothetical protein Hypma_005664 [Hypsizygus marmoreus]|uniref:Uncharacterized protein n=1 Tax=Hypsizygus marmoreus TaxID=39966 RepID=A0A369JVZ6_HYPMA|nr:hypothetical protein Hypma_005664 [Hypsizygus marmoreus]